MRLPQFYIQESLDNEIQLDKNDAHHIRDVLRMRTGEKVLLRNGNNEEAVCVLTEVSKTSVTALCSEKKITDIEPKVKYKMFPSLAKGERFEWLLQKIVELGGSEIIPVISENCVIKSVDEPKYERWRRIIVEASKQCGRGKIPILHNAVEYDKILGTPLEGVNIICYENESKPLKSIYPELLGISNVNIFTGPEGGYNVKEIEKALACSFYSVSLGKIIMRCETAPIAALSALRMNEAE